MSSSRAEERGETGNVSDVEQTLPQHINATVEDIVALRVRAASDVSRHQRAIERATAFLGQVRTLYAILAFILIWTGLNLLAPSFGLKAFDPPPFSWLIDLINVAALLFACMVLITQNGQGKLGEQREHLNLQVNLLAEQKIAKLIGLIEELRRDTPSVPDRHDAEAEAMTESIDPHLVVSTIEKKLEDNVK